MRKLLLYTRIAIVVLALFLGFLLVYSLTELSKAKAMRDRCTATTNGYISQTYYRSKRQAPDSNVIFYSFTVNDVEYHLHREFDCTLGEGRPHEGAITIHYNPDYIHEHYLGDSCYKVESAKDKVLLTILMWTVFLIALVGYIVKSLRSPGDYFD